MATFRLSQGILTEEWQSAPGIGGIRGWTCRGLCLDTYQAYCELTANQLLRFRFTEVPYRRELVCIPLDGSPTVWVGTIDIRLGPIASTNIAPPRYVNGCVKLGPVIFGNYAAMQDSGPYAGYSVTQYQVNFQPIWLT
jgi:hypothetical protein